MSSYSQWTEYEWQQWHAVNMYSAFSYLAEYSKYKNLPAFEKLIEHEIPGVSKNLEPSSDLPLGFDGLIWIKDEESLASLNLPNNNMDPNYNNEEDMMGVVNSSALQYPLCQVLMQELANWVNINTLIVPDFLHDKGMIVIFNISRALTMAVYSYPEKEQVVPNAVLVFIKRSLSHISLAIKTINDIEKSIQVDLPVINSIKSRLLQAYDLGVEHLCQCQLQINK